MRTTRPPAHLKVNRGAAYLDGLLFRGTEDGRVLAYDFKTGKRVWATDDRGSENRRIDASRPDCLERPRLHRQCRRRQQGREGAHVCARCEDRQDRLGVLSRAQDSRRCRLADRKARRHSTHRHGKTLPGTPITGGATWTSYTLDPTTGLLYVPGGNPAPDFATGPREGANLYSGSVVVLDAKTGAYKSHFKLVPKDWHDWDVSSAPALIQTRGGKELMSVAPKDGHLYGFDLATNAMLYRTPVTRIDNADATFATGKAVHFCPGSVGGAEWNGPAYDPQTNLILIGEVEWCTTVTLQNDRANPRREARQALVRNGDDQPLSHLRHARLVRKLGRMGLCRRCRYRGLEVAAKVQLSNPERHDPDGRRHRIFRRHGRQLLRLECGQRREAMGSRRSAARSAAA